MELLNMRMEACSSGMHVLSNKQENGLCKVGANESIMERNRNLGQNASRKKSNYTLFFGARYGE
jgi:hypothetical protein